MFTVKPIAFVQNKRIEIKDDQWGEVYSELILAHEFPEASLEGIEDFSHLEIVFYFNRVKDENVQVDSRYPRNNTSYPKVGIFAQRGKNRPNKIGLTTVELKQRKGRIVIVKGLDAIDGTPVLDIKPVMREFLPKGLIKQPEWSEDLMKNYW